jgi:coproporphyrinogen III oxidase
MITLNPSYATEAAAWIATVHDEITAFFTRADRGSEFREERWSRPGGGGGVTRVLVEGATFEKAGVNRSAVSGVLEPRMASRLALAGEPPEGAQFFATGVSVVAHPRSPMIPTVHLNVRYFELTTPTGEVFDAWFGGGTDLTPTYPFPDDAVHFHRVLAEICARHDAGDYPRFKAWCDDYFRNTHREGEARGVGGVFFDHLRPVAEDPRALQRFVDSIGRALPDAYGPIVERRRDTPYGERERTLQLARRGRYAEFNLLHDRGTSFGLASGARAESVLMSLPPLARWDHYPVCEPGSIEVRLQEMLIPRDWARVGLPATP